MKSAFFEWNAEQRESYLTAIDAALKKGMAAKEVVCSITTGFRSIPSIRTAPGLNPYHATVADIGYGFDAVRGTIKRLRQGEYISLVKEMLVFDLDTLRISEKQIRPNFELVENWAQQDTMYLVELSKGLNRQIAEMINEAIRLGQAMLGPEWEIIRTRIQNIQAIPRL
jgi:hypothetical protein